MRRIITLCASMLLIGSVLSGTAMAAKPRSGQDGVNPHIIADGTYIDLINYNSSNGDLQIAWKVAGLGKYGNGYLRIRGWVTMDVQCEYTRGNSTTRETSRVRDIRVNGRGIYADRSGNATDIWQLRPNAVCTNRGIVKSVTGTWTGLGVDLYGSESGSLIESRELDGCFTWDDGLGGAPVPC